MISVSGHKERIYHAVDSILDTDKLDPLHKQLISIQHFFLTEAHICRYCTATVYDMMWYVHNISIYTLHSLIHMCNLWLHSEPKQEQSGFVFSTANVWSSFFEFSLLQHPSPIRQPPVFNPVTQVVFHSRVKVTACGKTPMFTCFQSKGFPQSSMLQCYISVYHSTIGTSGILKTKTVSFECCQISLNHWVWLNNGHLWTPGSEWKDPRFPCWDQTSILKNPNGFTNK